MHYFFSGGSLSNPLTLDSLSGISASVAYSLNKLTKKFNGSPIRVRRSADNQESDIPFCGNSLCATTLTDFIYKYPPESVISSNAVTAYSLRKIKSSYNGNAIRVRRSSDNTEQDIGFTSSGDLDTTSLLSFVNGVDGWVTVWYDQIKTDANNYNLVQSTVGSQMRIVNAGVIESVNGRPAIRSFSGAIDALGISTWMDQNTDFSTTYANPNSISVVQKFNSIASGVPQKIFDNKNLSDSGYRVMLECQSSTANKTCNTTLNSATVTTGDTSNVVVGAEVTTSTTIPLGAKVLSFISNTSITFDQVSTATATNTNIIITNYQMRLFTNNNVGYLRRVDFNQNILSVNVNGASSGMYTNGVLATQDSGTGTNFFKNLRISGVTATGGANPSSGFMSGYYQEIILHKTLISDANRQLIEINQSKYYNISGTYTDANQGFVSKWYDQSGKGLDSSQGVAGNQPRIINAGTIDDGIFFNGSNNSLSIAVGSALTSLVDMSLYCNINPASLAGGSQMGIISGSSFHSFITMYLRSSAGADISFRHNVSGTENIMSNSGTVNYGQYNKITANKSGSTYNLYRDTTYFTGTFSTSAYATDTSVLTIGYSADISSPKYFSGYIKSLIIFAGALSQSQIAKLK